MTRRWRCASWNKLQAALNAAQNDVRSGETALEAGRNRLRILGKTNDEIVAVRGDGKDHAETPILRDCGTIGSAR